mmetsp:Transcript_17519/g.26526  ORF Transcript_17519/g.26526 Transcript_17519/m.26526 type:complete len:508 (+) Transcript_17519:69-1592(+)|eukprot:CAMPEP_0194246714 /NCGR_PEP_ID=MMETSP0158-20130606/15469_1 /TAXON_ID=33649 /ORGANISM="Thalassionema nitzschioides, Strain L26-B" /LENGTH=507 /DNA_ID=CAMNT_0038982689 /DNA_START=26 /DNA_END=1549 /DNA_ORIENTATION=-
MATAYLVDDVDPEDRVCLKDNDIYYAAQQDDMVDYFPTQTANSFPPSTEDEITETQIPQVSTPPHYGSISEIINNLGKSGEEVDPRLEQRVRDFKNARQRRVEKFGHEKPWGILGLYEHLASIRIDLEWAEDAAFRRDNNHPYLSWSDFNTKRKKGSNRPFFTYALLLICTVMLIVSFGVNGWKIEPLSVNPMVGPSAQTLLDLGAKQSALIVIEGEWWRIFTPMFLHAGIIHYGLNMMALWFVGAAIEKSHGVVNTAIAFIIAGIGGTVLSALFLPQYISVGASGGIFGFIGMCISDICVNWNLLFIKENEEDSGNRCRHFMVILWLLFDIIINCVIGLTPFIDNFTHLGGLIYGFLCGLCTIERLEVGFFGVATDGCTQFKNIAVRFSGLIVSVLLIVITTILLVESDGVSSTCNGCRYVSCVPFPPWTEDKFWHCDDCDQVSADAKKINTNSEYFDLLDLTCPNGQMESIDIIDEKVSDREVIRKNLPSYCRANCEVVFFSSQN